MASHTPHRGFGMSIAQHEFGSIMTKTSGSYLPVAFQMAIRTFFAQAGVVLVVFLVAADAVSGRLLEHRAFMAAFALHLAVLAQ